MDKLAKIVATILVFLIFIVVIGGGIAIFVNGCTKGFGMAIMGGIIMLLCFAVCVIFLRFFYD